MSTEYRCPACNLFFVVDLEPGEVKHCVLCAYQRPEPVTVTQNRQLCSECAGERKPSILPEQLEALYLAEIRAAFAEIS
jgi:hypothetical protein